MLGIGLLGCGRIGRVHAQNVAAHPGARLVAAYDPAPGAAAAVAHAHGARTSASVDDILADTSIAAVLIASSTDTHADLLTRAAQAGKAVFCEKPIALDIARVDACWAAIQALD